MLMSIMNKGNPENKFSGELKDRNILIHALSYFKNLNQEYVTRIFPNMDESDITLIQTVMITSGYFEEVYSKSAIHKIFKIYPDVYKRVREIGAEGFLSEHDKDLSEQESFELLIKEQVVLEVNKLRDEFKKMPQVENRKDFNWTVTLVLAAVSVISLIVSIKSCQVTMKSQKPLVSAFEIHSLHLK